MKIRKILKKIFAAIMVFTILFGGINILSSKTTANASANPVKMHSTDYYFSRYGISCYNVYIQVDANSAKNKAVYLYHSTPTLWTYEEATFLKKLDDNTEIWVAGTKDTSSGTFSIKYVGDGVTYWDNNNGKNYTVNDVVGTTNVKALRRHSANPNIISAVVKNLAYDKKVKVRYTVDNWNTYQDAYMSYVNSDYGINGELWSVNLDNLDYSQINSDGFHFCICYEVNGQTYWDNNFGQNYDKSYYRTY